jgi:hypothetical protein
MEGQVICRRPSGAILLAAVLLPPISSSADEAARQTPDAAAAEISLQKTIGARDYKGKTIEGDEREVRAGDSLWRILVKEKGVAEAQFKEIVVLIRGLNPALKTPDIIHVGDKIFIPINPNEALAEPLASSAKSSAEQGKTNDYIVKAGDHLYQIIRAHLGIQEERRVAQYFALVKDLNPQKTNWDMLENGETIRLPVSGGGQEKTSVAAKAPGLTAAAPGGAGPVGGETQTATNQSPLFEKESKGEISLTPPATPTPLPAPIGLDYAKRLPARENFDLIEMVAESLGNEVQRSGDEIVTLKDGAIRIDKTHFPVVYNRALDQRVILDGDNNIPESLRANLKQASVNAPVVSLEKNTTVQEAVGQLLGRLGYQPLPAERPVIIHDGGVAFEAKGQWAVIAPQQSNRPQEIIVINLADQSGGISEELKTHLSAKGLHLKNLSIGTPVAGTAAGEEAQAATPKGQARNWPRELPELVDALLLAYQIPFAAKESLATELRSGLSVEISADRTFDYRGRKTALFLRSIDPAIKAALESKHGIRAVELDVAALKSRDLIAKLLGELGEKVVYKEHRFSAAKGSLQDRLVMTAAGFLLPGRSLFLTDREIPPRFQPVFFEKGLDVVYFQ